MTGIQLGAGAIANSHWDTNYISAEEISHVNNVRLTEKIWDWLCDAVCGTHRAEAKECMRELSKLEGKGASAENLSKLELTFNKLLKLTSADYAYVDSSKNPKEYILGYVKKVNSPEIMQKWQVIEGKIANRPEFTMGGHKNLLLSEIESFDKKDLHQVPVYMAHRYAVSELSPPLHAYIMAGEPGSKNARIFGEKNDMTRSQVNIDDAFIVALSKAKYVSRNSDGGKVKLPFEPALINAVKRVQQNEPKFAFLDSFVDAVKSELKLDGAKMTLTESHRIGLGYIAAQQNGQEGFYNMDPRKGFTYGEDMRYFEHQKGPVKQQPIKLTTLQEISREQRVYQDYLNEKLGLNGLEQTKSSIYKVDGDRVLLESEKKALKARSMVAYTALPSDSPFEANCNRTAATYIQAAINREKGLPIDVYQEVKSGTKWALSGDTRRHIHNPLVSQKVDKASIGEQAFTEIQQRHPNISHQDEHFMILGKKKAEDLEAQNKLDTGYSRIRSIANSLSNFFASKS